MSGYNLRSAQIFADNYSRFYCSTTRTCFTFHVATIANPNERHYHIATIHFHNDGHSRSRYDIRIHSSRNRISPDELLKNYGDCRKLKRPWTLRSKSRNCEIISRRPDLSINRQRLSRVQKKNKILKHFD